MIRNILLSSSRGIPCCSKLLYSTIQNVSHVSNIHQITNGSNKLLSTKLLRFSNQFVQPVRNIFIQVQETPNPLTLKFLPGEKILENSNRTYEFTSASNAKQSPLAIQLFRVEGVKNVFYGEDFIAVTKQSEDEDWALMKPHIFATIMDYVQSGKPVITDLESLSSQPTDTTILPEDDDVVAMIKELLESRIKPMVQEDGGDVVYMGYEDGVVKLKMQGACTGCPSSAVTLKSGIKNMMQFYVPEIKDVIEVEDAADQLIEDELKKLETKLGKTAE